MIHISKLWMLSDEEALEVLLSHPISGGKGDKVAQSTETGQGEFTKTLQRAFATNNTNQQQQLAFLSKSLENGVTNPQGYSPETLAAMRTQATDTAAQNNVKVMQAVNEKNATEGGASATALPNGVQEQIEAGVGSTIANNEANAQLGITEQNGQLQNDNKWKAVQGEEGVAGLENPEGLASADNGAAGTVSNLSDAVTKANGPGIGSILGGIAGSALGAAGSAGGFGSLLHG